MPKIDVSYLKDWLQVALALVGIVAAIVSVCNYLRNSRRNRAQWLFDLYRRFYDDAELKRMAARIDRGQTDFIREADSKEAARELLSEFDTYLNFFEFIGYLYRKKQLDRHEVSDMFQYPLEKIAMNTDIASYLKQYGYERTTELIKELGYSKSHEKSN